MPYNRVVLMGNLTKDWELRFTPKGAAIANSSIAINRKWKTEDGDEKEEVSFFEVTAFGRTAETVSQYLKKGNMMLIEGRLKQDTWEDKETKKTRSKVIVILEQFSFTGGKASNGDNEEAEEDRPSRKQRSEEDEEEKKPFKKRSHDYSEDEEEERPRKKGKHPF